MNLVEKKIYNMNPRYLVQYEPLLKRFSQFGGGGDGDRYIQGRSFSNVYEFYIFAFFIGLYKGVTIDLTEDDKLNTFWEIKNWKPEELVNNLIVCALAKSEFDMLKVQRMEEDSEIIAEIAKLRGTIEGYANGGFKYILEQVDNNPDHAEQEDFFVKMLA